MKESILRAAAIAALALALVTSVLTWINVSTSSHVRGAILIGFFEFALILFLGVVAWSLFNALADVVTTRTTLDVLVARMARLERGLEAAGLVPPEPKAGPVSGAGGAGEAKAGRGQAGGPAAGASGAPGARSGAPAEEGRQPKAGPRDAAEAGEGAPDDRRASGHELEDAEKERG